MTIRVDDLVRVRGDVPFYCGLTGTVERVQAGSAYVRHGVWRTWFPLRWLAVVPRFPEGGVVQNVCEPSEEDGMDVQHGGDLAPRGDLSMSMSTSQPAEQVDPAETAPAGSPPDSDDEGDSGSDEGDGSE